MPPVTEAQHTDMMKRLDAVAEKMASGAGRGEAPPRYETAEKKTGVYPPKQYEDASFVEWQEQDDDLLQIRRLRGRNVV